MIERSRTVRRRPALDRRLVVAVLAIALMISVEAPGVARAKGIELTVFGGGILGGKSDARAGQVNVIDGLSYGATLGLNLGGYSPSSPQLELYYKRQDSELEFKADQTGDKSILTDISTQYMLLGFLRPLPRGDVTVYGVGSVGAVRFHPKSSDYDDEWLFVAAAGLGAKMLSRSGRIGLRFDARLLAPIEWGGGYIFCGGGGCNTGLSGGIVLLQIDFSAGIVVAF